MAQKTGAQVRTMQDSEKLHQEFCAAHPSDDSDLSPGTLYAKHSGFALRTDKQRKA